MKDFRLDASSDALVLENDADLRYFRGVSKRYSGAGADFVFMAYSPPEDLFSQPSLDRIKRLREELKGLPRVKSVVTILDVPLLMNPPSSLGDLKENLKTLEDPKANLPLAVAEFGDSPIYQNLMVSQDLKSCAIQVNFRTEESDALLNRREELRQKKRDGALSSGELGELEQVEAEYRREKDRVRSERHEDLIAIREIVRKYQNEAAIVLGGVPMIVDDMISFIKSDMKVFGAGMTLLLVGLLYLEFRRMRWVILPLLTCLASVFTMMGLLGLFKFDVTVISSNFTSLQLILTLQLAVHLVGHYRELLALHPEKPNFELVRESVHRVFVPAFYCQLTTIVGFASLIACDILPVVNFGWMMSWGLVVSLVNIFLILPAGMVLLPKPEPVAEENQFGHGITTACANFVERRRFFVLSAAGIFIAATVIGCLRLQVENSFVDYFKKSTEIYQGMKFIDDNLGGTTPLDVILEFPAEASGPAAAAAPKDEFSEFEEKSSDPSKYWFTPAKLDAIEKAHDYLDQLPETGKVLSLATLWKTARRLNGGKELDTFTTSLLYTAMPDSFQNVLVKPYAAAADNQTRLSVRIKDSSKTLRRDALIKKIRSDLQALLADQKVTVRISGLMVLYNNMLQSLFTSQIKTIAWTLLPLWGMFFLLWRSSRIALVALLPSIISTTAVLGFMGLVGIPLDMMTITVVAVALGIAVDNGTHYIHRFREEFALDGDYVATMRRCHSTIGHNMVNSALPVIFGFSILALSNFIPSILFGTLVAVAMIFAILSDLNLLPAIIITFKPFGPGKKP